MAGYRCEECGERFNSKMNFDYHRELLDCDRAPEDESESSAAKNENATAERNGPSPQRGPVATGTTGIVDYFDDDRGFGFVTTADITRKRPDGETVPEDVFFHISDVDSTWVEENDRLRFDVVEGDEGLRCKEVEVIGRHRDRKSEDEIQEYRSTRRRGFGHQKDDGRHGPGKTGRTNTEVKSFRDERKFR